MSGLIGAIRIPAAPATVALIIQLRSATPVRRDAAHEGAGLRVGRRPGDQAEPREAEHHRERDRQRDHGQRQVEAVRKDDDRSELPSLGGKDRRDADGGRPLTDGHELLDHDEDAKRRHRACERWRGPQWSEDDDVDERAEDRVQEERDGCGGNEPERPAQVDALGQARDQHDQLAVAQPGVGVRAVKRDGAGREVDDARAPVRQDEREGQGGEDTAVADAEEECSDVIHGCPLGALASRQSGISSSLRAS